VIDAGTRSVLFGPFYSDANPVVVADNIARRLDVSDRKIRIEWR
jgi:hypothetical protein